MHKHKLIIVYPNQFGYHTDSYKYCQYLPSAYDITYICFDQGFDRLQLPGIDVIYVPYDIGKIKRLLLYYKTVFKVCHSHPDNTLFTIQFKFSFLIGLFASSKLKILDFRTGDLSKSNLKRWLNNRILWFDSLFFQRVTVISSGLGKILKVNPKKTFYLPLGADEISSAAKQYNCLNLLYIGAIHHRNIFETVEGIAIFLAKNPIFRNKLKYRIIGWGSKEEIDHLQDVVNSHCLKDVVSYKERIKYTDLKAFFDESNVGVSYVPVTPWYEHQPVTKTFEYALSGLFTIATNTFENRKVINKDNGILIQSNPQGFAEGLELLITILPEIEEFKIRNSLIEYNWNRIVQKYLMSALEEKSIECPVKNSDLVKVLIVCSGNSDSISPFIQEQAKDLMSLGIQVEIFLIKGKGFLGYLKNYAPLLKTIKKYKPALIHAHYGLSGLLANLQRKVKVVTTFHGSDIWVFKRNRILSHLSYLLSAHSIVVEQKMTAVFFNKKHLSVIPCGVNTSTFFPISDRKTIIQNFDAFVPEKFNILFSSRFDYYEKNYPLAQEVMKLLGNKFNLIELKGYSRDDVNNLLNKCDLALMTSISEGSPQFIKEAMASNCPIVSTDVGDVSRVMGSASGCYLSSYNPVDIVAKIRFIIEFNINNTRAVGRNRIFELGLDSHTIAEQIVQVYNKVLKKTD